MGFFSRAETVYGLRVMPTKRSLVLLLVACGLTAACSSSNDEGSSGSNGPGSSSGGSDGGTSSSGASASESAKKGTVKISKGGSSVVEYTSEGVEGNIDGDQIYFELNSPDTKQVLHLTIHGRAAGSYEFAEQGAPGKAHILFLTEDKLPSASPDFPAEWSPSSGTLTLEKATDSHAKGSWTAKGMPKDDTVEYTVEGTFDVPLHVL
ncbi:MAG: hypothetical protein K0S65_508 [Labilithrix sp.]|nr:hypothetical protein [Labilithrix sp.]